MTSLAIPAPPLGPGWFLPVLLLVLFAFTVTTLSRHRGCP